MKLAIAGLAITFLAPSLRAQEQSIRIILAARSNVPTAEVMKNLQKSCPNVHLTASADMASFVLEATTIIRENHNYSFTLYDGSGDAVFSTESNRFGTGMKDVCKAITGAKK